ncbi:MAG: chromosomal replication initiator protein DnaA [Patescibacteria group bacterium]
MSDIPLNELWQAVLGELELLLSRAHFTTWFKHTFIIERDGSRLVIGVPNTFTKTWLENKYHQSIVKALRNVTNNELCEVSYQVQARHFPLQATVPPLENRRGELSPEATSPQFANRMDKYGLNPRYVFQSFVVGKSNELAHAAAKAVAQQPGVIYNPLFIYGGVGLGKTHLMQAIGHEFLSNDPSKKVLYTSCEKFTNEFVFSIKNGNADSFKDRYRTVDVLLIDDIHFMAGKEQTQEQFFHTFNELHQHNRQIVISSDRPPKALAGLEQRLLSRFEWGMIADIGLPDLETRIAILERKLTERNMSLDTSIVTSIASTIQSNIRELEGVLNRILAYQQLNGTVLTPELVHSLLVSMSVPPKRGAITPKHLMKVVAQYYDISIENLVGESRKKELVIPRQIVMYLMREEIKSSFPNIGAELGGRDHTTAMYAYTKIVEELEKNEQIRQDVTLIRQQLFNQSWDKG